MREVEGSVNIRTIQRVNAVVERKLGGYNRQSVLDASDFRGDFEELCSIIEQEPYKLVVSPDFAVDRTRTSRGSSRLELRFMPSRYSDGEGQVSTARRSQRIVLQPICIGSISSAVEYYAWLTTERVPRPAGYYWRCSSRRGRLLRTLWFQKKLMQGAFNILEGDEPDLDEDMPGEWWQWSE